MLRPHPPTLPDPTRRALSRRRGLVTLAALLAIAVGCTQAEGSTTSSGPTSTAGPAPTSTTEPPNRTTVPSPPVGDQPTVVPVEPGWTLTATPKDKILGYDAPDGTFTQFVTDKYYDIPTSLPVIEQRTGWLHLRLAPKPNGSTVWVKTDDVVIGKTPWRIVINLATTHLQLFKAGEPVLDAPVGIGLDRTPTATGDFFVTFLQAPHDASYGPFVVITSGHSEVLLTWEGFPDGILAIHGPIGADGIIGDTGAKVSNGCIRMHIEDQKKLAEVTPGTPIQIVAS